MEHSDLVAEMASIEHLATQDRLHLARMRRAQQLKVAKQKEKEWMKTQRRERAGSNASRKKQRITFQDNVVMMDAAARNDITEVARLLKKGVTPNAMNEDGLTALHQACIDNNSEMLRLLLDYGADVDAQDSEKWTPLHAASTCGHLNLVKILISRAANLLAVNGDGNMPYDLCEDEETLDYIEAEMSRRGVTQELIDETRAATEMLMLNELEKIAAKGGDLEVADNQGATQLHIAAANGYSRVVEFLLEQHVAVDTVDNDYWTPVHAAACWGHLEIVEMLAQSGADLNAKNRNEESPSDICEDAEIRERIEQLKTEQESKRLAEAQRRRVRRSQSNNTRAQSVRRTSLRDKTLTTKKDAVEETRLRLQAQEAYTTVDGPTNATNSIASNDGQQQTESMKNGSGSGNGGSTAGESLTSNNSTLSNNSSIVVSSPHSNVPMINNNSYNNNNTINNNQHNINNNSNNHQISDGSSTAYINHNNNNNNNNSNNNNNNNNHSNNINNYHNNKTNGRFASAATAVTTTITNTTGTGTNVVGPSTATTTTAPTMAASVLSTTNDSDGVNILMDKRRSPEGKDNEAFVPEDKNRAMLMAIGGTVTTPQQSLIAGAQRLPSSKSGSDISTEIFSTSNENGKINVQVTVLFDQSIAGTLADLKKHRAQSRTSGSPDNGSIVTSQSVQSNGELGANVAATTATSSVVDTQTQKAKFSGITSDVVSDSTHSRRCCTLQ